MKKQMMVKAGVVFGVLTVAGVSLVAIPLVSASGIVSTALPILGGSIFAAALAFFMVEMFQFSQE
jgi:hypothetical protein